MDLLTWLRRILVALCLLKAIDVADRASLAMAILWVVAAIALWLRPEGGAVVAVVAALTFADGLRNQHLYLFAWLGVVMVLSPRVDHVILAEAVRWQATIVYVFAALSKLTEDYLSGLVLVSGTEAGVIAELTDVGDASPAVAISVSVVALLAELAMPALLWVSRLRPIGYVVGALLHGGMVLALSHDPAHAVRLTVFSGLMVAMWPAFDVPRARKDRPPPVAAQLAVSSGARY